MKRLFIQIHFFMVNIWQIVGGATTVFETDAAVMDVRVAGVFVAKDLCSIIVEVDVDLEVFWNSSYTSSS